MTPVLIDARVLDRPPTGIGRYTEEIGRRLPSRGIRLTALVGPNTPAPPWATDIVRARSPFLSPAEQIELPLLVARWRLGPGRNGTFFVPSYNAACLAPGPLAVTIHDANHLAFPELYGAKHRIYYRTVVKLASERARVVFCPSRFARDELVERIGVRPDRCVVTPLGGPERGRPNDAAIEKARAKYGLPNRYVLYVGNFKPHKNLTTLLRGAHTFTHRAPLVLLGGTEAELGTALSAARTAGARVVVVPSVGDDSLWALLAGAATFVFPSRYEGFGLPPLEALSLGVPVVTSTAASLPEVVGDAAISLDPDDVEGFGREVLRVLEDDALAAELRARGLARAREFSWETTANQTAAALGGR